MPDKRFGVWQTPKSAYEKNNNKGETMSKKRIALATLVTSLFFVTQVSGQGGNIITGDGFPNPNQVVTNEWGDLPSGRQWGSTA